MKRPRKVTTRPVHDSWAAISDAKRAEWSAKRPRKVNTRLLVIKPGRKPVILRRNVVGDLVYSYATAADNVLWKPEEWAAYAATLSKRELRKVRELVIEL